MSNPSPARLADAGRELDALIAEKVMGWKQYRVADYPPQSDGAALRCWHRPNIDAPCGLPAFSTDVGAAWLVVEKMMERGFTFDLSSCTEGWYVLFDSQATALKNSARTAATPPHAICLAALAALSEDAHA